MQLQLWKILVLPIVVEAGLLGPSSSVSCCNRFLRHDRSFPGKGISPNFLFFSLFTLNDTSFHPNPDHQQQHRPSIPTTSTSRARKKETMTTMRGGKYQSRSHAILNSPIIRSHLTPFISTAFTAAPIIIDRQTMDEGEEEGGGELIPTQPLATASTLKAGAFQIRTTTTTTTTQNERKRRRTSSVDDDDEAVVVVEVETRYTADNLPPELTKCAFLSLSLFSSRGVSDRLICVQHCSCMYRLVPATSIVFAVR